ARFSERRRGLTISNPEKWTYQGKDNDIYQTEHDEMFAAIRKGETINNGDYMAKSTLLAIMGRMAAYTGQLITWEDALNSKDDLSPAGYTWDSAVPDSKVAMPGVTKFI
ncbi:MAG: gfo/Idh/MocA family oxidoreductase, partial [Planctomycetales bacterium]